ncbi:MAG: helix-turn-helix domain-containing protein [Candidatus Bathyarchaeota archaeon]|nr:MAG: helix-turn-helix domain-containing protein [Candidatus Bathyarchaeota archaeon]
MSKLPLWEEVARLSLESDEAFRKALKKSLKESHIDAKKFSKLSGVSESSLYKILSGNRANPRLSTYRKIVKALKKLEGIDEGEPFIAVIAARPTLDAIEARYIQVRDYQIQLREYAATSIEEVIIAAVRAQQEGAKAIVCAPIVSTTVEKIAKVPVSACPVLQCRQPLLKAAEAAASKISLE